MITAYLAGPIHQRSDADCKDWREAVKLHLPNTIDPMRRDYRGREAEPGIAGEIVVKDKADIDQCDVLLVRYDKPSVGTSMEVLYAWERKKPVVLWADAGVSLSPWLLYHSTVIVNSLREAIAAIRRVTA